jgi:hypothetical protein
MEPRGRERHRWAKPRGRNGRERMSQRGQQTSFKSLLILIRSGDMKNVRLAVYERRLVSTEKPLNQFVTADFKMRSHVIKNSGQCSHFKRVVIGNRDMMLAALSGRQPQMATRLPCDFVAQAPQPFGKIRSRNISR